MRSNKPSPVEKTLEETTAYLARGVLEYATPYSRLRSTDRQCFAPGRDRHFSRLEETISSFTNSSNSDRVGSGGIGSIEGEGGHRHRAGCCLRSSDRLRQAMMQRAAEAWSPRCPPSSLAASPLLSPQHVAASIATVSSRHGVLTSRCPHGLGRHGVVHRLSPHRLSSPRNTCSCGCNDFSMDIQHSTCVIPNSISRDE